MPFGQTGTPSFFYQPQTRPAPWFLVASFFYGLAVRLHQALYDWGVLPTYPLSVPVISVGNLTVGGTGKTPVTLSLAQWLESKGLRVVVLSRGYGASVKTQCHRADGPQYGDEPYTIQQGLTHGVVVVGPNRVKTGRYAVEAFKPQVMLLDDGFQHRRLKRDVDIVLVDGQLGLGNHRLLPAGPLREPVSALKRAQFIFLTKAPSESVRDRLETLCANVLQSPPLVDVPFEVCGLLNPDTQGMEPLASVRGQDVVLLSGIAQPQSFEAQVQTDLGARVVLHHALADHHGYTALDLKAVEDRLLSDPKLLLLTTTKDWVKVEPLLSRFVRHRVRVVMVSPQVDWESLLGQRLSAWGVC